MRKRKSTYPDMLEIWGITWTKASTVWVGPAISDPENEMLALAVEYQRIIRRDGHYVMEDPGLTLDCFGWEEGDITLTEPVEEANRLDVEAVINWERYDALKAQGLSRRAIAREMRVPETTLRGLEKRR